MRRVDSVVGLMKRRRTVWRVSDIPCALVTLWTGLVVLHVIIAGVMVFGVDPLHSDPMRDNASVRLPSAASVYKRVTEHIVPDLRAWVRGQARQPRTSGDEQQPTAALYEPLHFVPAQQQSLASLQHLVAPSASQARNCTGKWVQKAVEAMGGTLTTPEEIDAVTTAIGFDTSSGLIQSLLGDLLTKPVDLGPMMEQTATCVARIPPVAAMACLALQDDRIRIDTSGVATEHVTSSLRAALHLGAVLDRVSARVEVDPQLWLKLLVHLQHHRLQSTVDWMEATAVNNDEKEFRRAKLLGVFHFNLALATERLQGLQGAAKDATHARAEALVTQVNILEAVHMDFVHGLHANAKVGAALAAETATRRQRGVAFGTGTPAHSWTRPEFGRDYAEDYIAWNLAFVAGLTDTSFAFFPKLLTPSLTCGSSAPDGTAGDFVGTRISSLLFTIFYMAQDSFPGKLPPGEQLNAAALAMSWGAVNQATVRVPDPTQAQLESMLLAACPTCDDHEWSMTATSPQAAIDDDDDYLAFLVCVFGFTTVYIGIGSEVLVSRFLLASDDIGNAAHMWRYAQFVFPFAAVVALAMSTRHDYWALPVLVAGFWKFGFPETLYYIIRARRHGWWRSLEGCVCALDGLGLFLHHSSAAVMCVCMMVGLLPPVRTIVAPTVVTIIQHWFVLIKYHNKAGYIIAELVLEVWFEWEWFAALEDAYDMHYMARHLGVGLLVAHWLYLLSGALLIVSDVAEAVERRKGGVKRLRSVSPDLEGGSGGAPSAESPQSDVAGASTGTARPGPRGRRNTVAMMRYLVVTPPTAAGTQSYRSPAPSPKSSVVAVRRSDSTIVAPDTSLVVPDGMLVQRPAAGERRAVQPVLPRLHTPRGHHEAGATGHGRHELRPRGLSEMQPDADIETVVDIGHGSC